MKKLLILPLFIVACNGVIQSPELDLESEPTCTCAVLPDMADGSYVLFDRWESNIDNQIKSTGFEDEKVDSGTLVLFDDDSLEVCDGLDISRYDSLCINYRYALDAVLHLHAKGMYYYEMVEEYGFQESLPYAIMQQTLTSDEKSFCIDLNLVKGSSMFHYNGTLDKITIDGTITLDSVILK